MRICEKHPDLLGKRYKDGHCYECVKERVHKWYLANKDKDNKRCRDQYKAEPEKYSVRAKAWRKANQEKAKSLDREKYLAMDREKRNAQSLSRTKAYRKRHPDRHAADVSKRNAHKKQTIPTWANPIKIQEFYHTAKMLGMHTGEFYHVDHIVPLKSKIVCGLHCEANLRIILATENQSKGNRYWPDMPTITYPA